MTTQATTEVISGTTYRVLTHFGPFRVLACGYSNDGETYGYRATHQIKTYEQIDNMVTAEKLFG